jgi:hypothetical protein
MRPLTLTGSELLSKWGFDDGDAVTQWWEENVGADCPSDAHGALRLLVRAELLPAVEAAGIEIDVYDIGTIHNPIRARAVNGCPVDATSRVAHPCARALSAVVVVVAPETVRAAAARAGGATPAAIPGKQTVRASDEPRRPMKGIEPVDAEWELMKDRARHYLQGEPADCVTAEADPPESPRAPRCPPLPRDW